jgi:hypothetical protein
VAVLVAPTEEMSRKKSRYASALLNTARISSATTAETGGYARGGAASANGRSRTKAPSCCPIFDSTGDAPVIRRAS